MTELTDDELDRYARQIVLPQVGGVGQRRLKAAQTELDVEFGECWDDAERREDAERLVRRMQFLDKLTQEVRHLEERLDD